jgi:hypothetical protein
MSALTDQLIRLGNNNPELREHIRPLLQRVAGAGVVGSPATYVISLVRDKLREMGIRTEGGGDDYETLCIYTDSNGAERPFRMYYDIPKEVLKFETDRTTMPFPHPIDIKGPHHAPAGLDTPFSGIMKNVKYAIEDITDIIEEEANLKWDDL